MMLKSCRTVVVAAAAAVALALNACGAPPSAPNSTSGSAGVAANFDQYATLTGQQRRDRLIEDAKAQGGEVSLYTSMTSDVAQAVTKAFTDQTGIKISLYRANGETVLQRLLQEAGAKHPGADVMESDALEMEALHKEGLAAPYTSERRDLVAKDGQFDGWTATRYNLFAPSWNTNRVHAGEQPKVWEDLADPKWNGQLAMELSDYDWYLTLYEYWEKQGKSTAEIDKLFADMADGAKVVKGHTVIGELLSAGQFSVAASNYTYLVQAVIEKGAPVAYEPLVDPVIKRPNGIALVKAAPHPAAALLFTDWMLTEGQTVIADMGLTPAIVPAGHVDQLKDHNVITVDVATMFNGQKEWSERYQALIENADRVDG